MAVPSVTQNLNPTPPNPHKHKMKKFIFFLLLTATMFACQRKAVAQSLIPLKTSGGALFDTLSDAGTVTFTTAANAISANRTGAYGIQFKATNVSGTSTYKVLVQGSLDGTNFVNVNQVAGTTGVRTDTLQVTSGSPAYWIFRVTPNASNNAGKFRYLRLRFVGTGTQKTRITDVYAINE